MNRGWGTLGLRMWMVVTACLLPSSVTAGKRARALECHLDYAGQSQVLAVPPTSDPYAVAPVPVLERFAFKAVYVDQPDALAGINLYVYVLEEPDLALIPLHHAKYRPPYPDAPKGAHHGFTGLISVYEHEVGRTFQYWCQWVP